MHSLNKQEYICNLFNTDSNVICGTEITDSGLVAVKNYKIDLTKYIFKRYIWVVFCYYNNSYINWIFYIVFYKINICMH